MLEQKRNRSHIIRMGKNKKEKKAKKSKKAKKRTRSSSSDDRHQTLAIAHLTKPTKET